MRLPSRMITALPISAAVLLGPAGCQKLQSSSEKPIAMTDVTPEARATIEREAGGAKLMSLVTSEDDAGKPVYEAEFLRGQSEVELEVGPDGLVYSVEEAMSPAELPNAVRESILREIPTAMITEAKKVTKSGVVTFEVEAEMKLSSWEMTVSPQGAVLQKELKEFNANAGAQKPAR